MGKIIRVDLTRGIIKKEELSEELKSKYLGGYGIASRILYDEVPPWVGALDPANRLIFSTGPITGTMAPTAGRHTIVTKSPLTGYSCDANAGGYWGVEFKFTGHDIIIITGRATNPSLISIRNDDVEIKSAQDYWGMNARAADRAIRSDMGDKRTRVACIGQAGENLSRISGIMSDDAGRCAARGGVGAVMGFFNLKAVTVAGDNKVSVSRPDELRNLSKTMTENAKNNPNAQNFSKGGTPGFFESIWALGDVPAYNWSRNDYGGNGDPGVRKIAYPGGYESILKNTKTCYVCPVSCRREVSVESGPYSTGEIVEGPEYETMSIFGPNCGIDDIQAISKLNDLCNIYGIDTISCGATISFAMECFDKGIITKEDTGGFDLKFGNTDAVIEMVHKIAKREDFGDMLADGSRRAAAAIGKSAEKYAMHVKGQEISAHDPRAAQSQGIIYATSITGARHNEGFTLFLELGGWQGSELPYPNIGDRFSTEGKGIVAKIQQDWRTYYNAAGFCGFADLGGGYPKESDFVKIHSAVTGQDVSLANALLYGQRIFNLRRILNIRYGCTPQEDTLPQRFLESNEARGIVKLNQTLPQYYEARGWNPTTGKPRREKIRELGLEDIAADL